MPRGITEAEVFRACDALLLEGARPTIERVRQKLGRGSPNTVSPMLEIWFKHLGARIKDPGAFAAPASLPDAVDQAAQHLWETAQAEARRELDLRLSEGLAAAMADVKAEKERGAIADAAALSATAKATQLRAELDQMREALDAERAAHAATRARLDDAQLRCSDLGAELGQARQASEAARARADVAISAADQRAAGAERRAALEIEQERGLRTKAEKLTESIARKLEVAMKAQVAATEQVCVVEGRLAQFKVDAARREEEYKQAVDAGNALATTLTRELADSKVALTKNLAQEELLKQLLTKLTPPPSPADTSQRRSSSVTARRKKADA